MTAKKVAWFWYSHRFNVMWPGFGKFPGVIARWLGWHLGKWEAVKW